MKQSENLLTVEQMTKRSPVWLALSDLFLDSELQESDYRHISSVLIESGYSITTIESILFEEVFPVCIPNLRSVAGEPFGFDEEWLESSILQNISKGKKVPLLLRRHKKLIADDWRVVRELVLKLKSCE